jgi:hypothetical protein
LVYGKVSVVAKSVAHSKHRLNISSWEWGIKGIEIIDTEGDGT